jgi:predicted nucleic acid-binding protein
MLEKILIDSGPLIALFDRDDNYHQKIMAFMKDQPFQLVTTVAVLTEVSRMLDFNINARIGFFAWVMSRGVIIEKTGPDDIPHVIALIRQYRDVPMDFVAATLMTVAEKKQLQSIISLDSNFNIYCLPGKVVLKNEFLNSPIPC